jgi:hypothetical protein
VSPAALRRALALCLLLSGVLAAARPGRADEPPPASRRIALLVAASDGGPGRARLRYASRDIEAVARVLTELGGVRSEDIEQVIDPDPAAVERRLNELKQRLTAPGSGSAKGRQLFFYYSGHSDEQGLLLFGAHLPYSRLRALITDIPADVHIGVLDSCASGAFAQRKGGVAIEPFLVQSGASVTGHAFLTSTSEREAAQESARLRGSFFTHFLVTGLRGAADVDSDQRVTLQEAYRFAFAETLQRTEVTLGGPQHAAYDIQLVGRGDLVLTDLRDASARLSIAAPITGRIVLRDQRGALAAELVKPSSQAAVVLSLEAGTYRVTVDDGKRVRRAIVLLPQRGAQLEDTQLYAVALEPATQRGGPPVVIDDEVALAQRDDPDYRIIPANAGVVPPLYVNRIERERRVINYLSVNLLWGRAARVTGADLGLAGGYITEELRGLQGALLFTYAGGRVLGAQGSAVVNIAAGDLFGGQLGTVNVALGDVNGLQAAAGVSYARGDVRGVQLGNLSIAARSLVGVQIGMVNYAARPTGVQLGGLNLASQSRGLQAGFINFARGRARGVQLGLINIADDADVAIGLLSISRRHGAYVDLWMSDVAGINVSVRLPARYSYSLFSMGVHPDPSSAGAAWTYGVGFGFHAPLTERLYAEFDQTVHGVQSGFAGLDMPSLLSMQRLLLGVRIARRFAVFGGATFNMLWGFREGEAPERPGFRLGTEAVPAIPGGRWRMWPGFALGIQI